MVDRDIREESSDRHRWYVEARTVAHLDYWIQDYFDGLEIAHEPDGSSLLTGEMQDMPAVYGLILKLRDSGVTLVSLRVERTGKR